MAQRRWAHFDELVCLKAPSVFGQKIHVCNPQLVTFSILATTAKI